MRHQTLNHPIDYFVLMRFHKPVGIFLLMWPTLWGLWIAAKGIPPLFILSIFLIGVIVMRAAGCVINDIADRHVDCHVERTKTRPLTAKKLTLKSALILFFVLYAIAFTLVCFLNHFTMQLALAAAALAIVYPFTKRFTHWPQFILGLAFSWSIPMAFAATNNHISGIGWWLFATSVLWTITYDTEYAMTDRAEDIKMHLKSTAILFGKHDRLILSLLQSVIVLSLLGLGWALSLRWPYFVSVGGGALIFLYHQRLIVDRDPKACFKAFLNNNYFGFIIFLGIFLSYL